MEHRALGKGLSALIPEKTQNDDISATNDPRVTYISTAQIRDNKNQPRAHYDQSKLDELIASIKEQGVLQPLLIRPKEGAYEVVAGERRLKAARALTLDEVPVIIKDVSDREAIVLALVENIQREELNAIEEAVSFKQLIEQFGYSQEQVAQAVGKDRSTISNTLRLLKLSAEMQASIIDGTISMGHARALLGIDSPAEQKKVFDYLLKHGLSVREVEGIVQKGLKETGRRRKLRTTTPNSDVVFIEDDLQKTLGTKVRVLARRKRGKIVIEFYSPADLERIINIIKG